MRDYILQKVIFHKMTKNDMPPHHFPLDLCHPKASLVVAMFWDQGKF